MNVNFSRQLIKGRVAEIIFQQMFGETGLFTIIPFGYEYTMPDLPPLQRSQQSKETLDTIRSSPDFAIISRDKKDVSLIEVKFRTKFDPRSIQPLASKQLKRWNPSLLFIATLDGFYLDRCARIVKRHGQIAKLSTKIIKKADQNKYLELLKEFEQ